MTCFTFNILNYVNIILRGWLHSLIAAHVEGSFSSSSISLAELCSLRWAAGGAACTKGLRAAPSCHDFPTKNTLKTQNHFYSLVWAGVWLPNAEQRLCRVKLYLDKAVLENQVGFCPIQWGFAEGEGIAPFPGRAGHILLFPALGLWGCCRLCSSAVGVVYSHFPPSFFDPWLCQAECKEGRNGNGSQAQQTLNLSLSAEPLWQYSGRCSWLRLLGKGELLQFPSVPLYFQHPEPWASTQQQGITFKEAAPASGWLVLDPQISSRKVAHGATPLVHCQKWN